MTKSEQKAVKDYFNDILGYKTKSDYREHPINALVFSYLVGMDPEECHGMELESEMSREEINEYYDIEGYINQLVKELEN